MCTTHRLAAAILIAFTLLVSGSTAKTKLNSKELKEAERRLSELGYSTGRVDGVIDSTTRQGLITFQKWEGRKITGQLTRAEFNAILEAVWGHRVTPEVELQGLDIPEMGALGYPEFVLREEAATV